MPAPMRTLIRFSELITHARLRSRPSIIWKRASLEFVEFVELLLLRFALSVYSNPTKTLASPWNGPRLINEALLVGRKPIDSERDVELRTGSSVDRFGSSENGSC